MKKFFALVALVAVALTSCDKGNDGETTKSVIRLYETEVVFANSGGEKIVGFGIDNAVGGKATAQDDAEWLDAEIVFNGEVTITAEANEGDAREAKVTIKYADAKDAIIVVKQKAGNVMYDIEYEAKHLEGTYFGTQYSDNHNYFVILSDIGATAKGEVKSNGVYYFFDFYSKVAGNAESPVLPNGTYTFDANNTLGDLTFSDDGSWYQEQENGKTIKAANIKSATVVVESGKFDAIIEFTTGEVHRVTYEGDLTLGFDEVHTTFNKDVKLTVDGAAISAANYGDILGNGLQAWYIEAVKGDELFMLEIFTASANSPAGVYTALAASDNNYSNKFIPGIISDGMAGTWYAKLTNGAIKGDVMAPFVDGLVKIEVAGNTATISYSVRDDAGNQFDCTVSGSYTKTEVEK
ncbi:MAG: hypothetical protein IIX19_05480 [Alistipes sp.]|nr:hypothetical protein [Alistipes sp.]